MNPIRPLFCAPLLALVAHAEPLIQRDTVVSFSQFKQSCYPSIERLANDHLLCAFSAIDGKTGGKMVVAAVISGDNGRSWSKPRILIDTPDQYDYDPNIVVIGERVIVSSTTTPKGEAITTSRTIAVRSDDNAQTWSKPYDIAMGHRYTSGKINNGIMLRDKTVLFGYTWEAQLEKIERLPSESDMIERSGVMISHDGGETWTNGGDVIDDKLKDPSRKLAISGICEPAIVECSDGSLYMLSRTGLDHLYESRSTNGGRSWSNPQRSPLMGHNAPASLCRFKGKTREGILVVWDNSPVDRWPLCVAASYDDAKTWSRPRVIADTPGFECSYPGCTQAADGSLVVLWQQAGKKGREILSARFEEDWLTGGGTPASAPARHSSILPGRTEHRGGLRVEIGDVRVVMRGPMFPRLSVFSNGSITLTADAQEEGGKTTSIRSNDGGRTWKGFDSQLTHGAGFNTVEVGDKALAFSYDTKPLPDRPGVYSTTRWESRDHGRTATEALTDGTITLPPDQFDPKLPQWFHGNIIRLRSGDLLAAMQGRHKRGDQEPFRCFVSRSSDQGKSWKVSGSVANLDTIDDPAKRIRSEWHLHGPCEPALLELEDGQLLCVMRLVNDDSQPPVGQDSEEYQDLSTEILGSDIHPSLMKASAERYYRLGEPSVPLIASFSSDDGRTWSRAEPITPGRGCFPRLQRSGNLIALTYGGLAFPRWGNAISFSTDKGKSWSEEVILGPYLTTGYSDIACIGPNRFICVFDAAPPQPWKNHASHWLGAVDVNVEVQSIPPIQDQLNVSAMAMSRPDASWVRRHLAINARARQGHVDIVFLGDSITHRWEDAGKAVWQREYGDRALNAGIDGDGTQTVLWRIQNGNLDGIHPQVAVLMIGTNNSTDPHQSPADIADGIKAIVREVRRRLPQTHVLLLAIFPRGQMPTPERERGAEASRLASQIADGVMVHNLDIGSDLLEKDGSISADVMPDFLHLSSKGYEIWARGIRATLASLMKD